MEYSTSDCVDLRQPDTKENTTTTVGVCYESPYNTDYLIADDSDPYSYSWRYYSTSDEALSTVNMTGLLVTER